MEPPWGMGILAIPHTEMRPLIYEMLAHAFVGCDYASVHELDGTLYVIATVEDLDVIREQLERSR